MGFPPALETGVLRYHSVSVLLFGVYAHARIILAFDFQFAQGVVTYNCNYSSLGFVQSCVCAADVAGFATFSFRVAGCIDTTGDVPRSHHC